WRTRDEKEVMEYIANRFANAYPAGGLPPWARGMVYYIIDQNDSGLKRVKQLNGYINTNKNTKGAGVPQDLTNLISTYENGNDFAKKAAIDLQAFYAHINGNFTNVNRFSYIEFKDGGRYCVGPIEFEKSNLTESVDPSGKVKKGKWVIPGRRVLLPKHFATNSIEWDGGEMQNVQFNTINTGKSDSLDKEFDEGNSEDEEEDAAVDPNSIDPKTIDPKLAQ
ncbi:hypothetical protein HYY75_02680, partial [bacterium]|nr:hypothetical protein [bacterium]